jgi:ribosome-associated protein
MNQRLKNIKQILTQAPTELPKPKDKSSKKEFTNSLVFYAAKLAEEKKATDIEILDVRSITDITDFIIIVSGDNPAQLKTIARHIEESFSQKGLEPIHSEGNYGDKWFLLDYSDFVVHIIDEEAREFYNLEELWHKAFFIPKNEWLEP